MTIDDLVDFVVDHDFHEYWSYLLSRGLLLTTAWTRGFQIKQLHLLNKIMDISEAFNYTQCIYTIDTLIFIVSAYLKWRDYVIPSRKLWKFSRDRYYREICPIVHYLKRS
jgi:ACT domain-containing protein